MKSKKNFYIIRFFLIGKCIKALSIKKKETKDLWPFFKKEAKNNVGGKTIWFDVDIDPKIIKPLEIDKNNLVV